jgi:hypothetical protein
LQVDFQNAPEARPCCRIADAPSHALNVKRRFEFYSKRSVYKPLDELTGRLQADGTGCAFLPGRCAEGWQCWNQTAGLAECG